MIEREKEEKEEKAHIFTHICINTRLLEHAHQIKPVYRKRNWYNDVDVGMILFHQKSSISPAYSYCAGLRCDHHGDKTCANIIHVRIHKENNYIFTCV